MAIDKDDFATAFEEAATAADAPEDGAAPAGDEPKKDEGKPAGDESKKDEGKPAGDESKKDGDEDESKKDEGADEAKKAEEAKRKAEEDAKAKMAEIRERAKLEAQAKLEAEKEAAEAKRRAEEEAKAAAEAAKFPDLEMTEEEKKAVEQLAKDWPEAHKAMEAVLKQREHGIKKLFATTLQQVVGELYKDIAALRGSAMQSEEDRHFTTLARAHPELNEILPPGKEDDGPLRKWIDTQPKIYKSALERVYNEGTTEEMIELIATFKEVTGFGKKADQDGETAAAAAEKERKAAALAAVPSKRTAVRTAQPDPNNFDAAFEEATADEKRR